MQFMIVSAITMLFPTLVLNEKQSGASRISQSLVDCYWGQNGSQLDDASSVMVLQVTLRCESPQIFASRFKSGEWHGVNLNIY